MQSIFGHFPVTEFFNSHELISQGRVTSTGMVAAGQTVAYGETMRTTLMVDYTLVSSSPNSCSITGFGTPGGHLSLRRIGKIEVMTTAEWGKHIWPDRPFTFTPSAYVLEITNPDGKRKDLPFRDEALADRVAKAMVHAAELCGAGAKKEPF